MPRYKTHPIDADGWTDWILPCRGKPYKIRCCDCCLVHELEFITDENGMVRFRARRNERATAASRAKRKTPR